MYIKILNYITNGPTCFGASAPSSGNFDIAFAKFIKVLNLHKTVDGFILIFNCIRSHYHILSIAQILSYNDLLFNPLNLELNPICYLLALLGAHHFLHVSRIRVKLLTLRRLMSYIYIWSIHS